ncbi:MAG: ribonuclease [Patescibacteria group bacterium]|jgi:ribonuclease HI|nr:ribonuclease [Patescibacteria group bacterium]
MSGRIRIHGDGGSRGNPGPAAGAAVLLDADGKVIEKRAEYMGVATNNQAEYLAVELGLQAMHDLKLNAADFYLDSQLVVRQLNGQYKVKHPEMRAAYERIQKLKEGFDVTFTHVMRADNTIADDAVNECLDAQ